MRENGVLVSGLGLAALGILGLTWPDLLMVPVEAQGQAKVLWLGILSCGAIVACLGVLLRPKRLYRPSLLSNRDASRKGDRRAETQQIRKQFGQRADYNRLNRVAALRDEPQIAPPLKRIAPPR